MSLRTVQRTFERLGHSDPFWAVLTDRQFKNNRWDVAEFFETGRVEIRSACNYVTHLGIHYNRHSALDFGCGVGRLSQALCDYFDHVVGVDISASMIATAQQHNQFGDRCRYLLNRAEDLSCFDDSAFDFVYTNITLQHMAPEYARGYITEFLRVLRPRGVAVFQIPSEPITRFSPGSWRGKMSALQINYVRPLWNKLRNKPVIEMHAVPRAEIERLIASNGGKMIDVVPDTSAGRNWQSFRYCAARAA